MVMLTTTANVHRKFEERYVSLHCWGIAGQALKGSVEETTAAATSEMEHMLQ